ncbi:MAG: acetyl-CoA carboxylase carboxyltransferase subunit alpha [Candidatus Glassbacteria bacterium]|nr:acetyl-CoA carboxylase carboxyltransferase subunit alpha [Candidatus Glassbacteria bacterium]
MNGQYLDFEKPIQEVVQRIEELRRIARTEDLELNEEIEKLGKKLERLRVDIYRKITPYQRVQLARHPSRPYSLDYINTVFEDFIELHGDRVFRDDPSIVAGWARLSGQSVMVIGQQKGRDTKDKIFRNFGMAHPEGYRKALRLMKMAEKFNRPIITLIDTPGAYPGIGAEERGQAEAIARNLREMILLRTPLISVVIGEGGSGGALALGLGNRVLMQQNAIYSVISPEGCASILWRDDGLKEKSAKALKLDAESLKQFGIVDEIIPEPNGGAHSDFEAAAASLKTCLATHLKQLSNIKPEELVNQRVEKYAAMGAYSE